MGIGQSGLIAADLLDFLIIRWNLGDLGPCFPWGSIISGSWTVCRLTWTVCHLTSSFFIFLLRCAVMHFISILHFVVIIMCTVMFYMIVLMPYVLCFAG